MQRNIKINFSKLNNQSILMVVNVSNDGIYERIDKQKELYRGEHY